MLPYRKMATATPPALLILVGLAMVWIYQAPVAGQKQNEDLAVERGLMDSGMRDAFDSTRSMAFRYGAGFALFVSGVVVLCTEFLRTKLATPAASENRQPSNSSTRDTSTWWDRGKARWRGFLEWLNATRKRVKELDSECAHLTEQVSKLTRDHAKEMSRQSTESQRQVQELQRTLDSVRDRANKATTAIKRRCKEAVELLNAESGGRFQLPREKAKPDVWLRFFDQVCDALQKRITTLTEAASSVATPVALPAVEVPSAPQPVVRTEVVEPDDYQQLKQRAAEAESWETAYNQTAKELEAVAAILSRVLDQLSLDEDGSPSPRIAELLDREAEWQQVKSELGRMKAQLSQPRPREQRLEQELEAANLRHRVVCKELGIPTDAELPEVELDEELAAAIHELNRRSALVDTLVDILGLTIAEGEDRTEAISDALESLLTSDSSAGKADAAPAAQASEPQMSAFARLECRVLAVAADPEAFAALLHQLIAEGEAIQIPRLLNVFAGNDREQVAAYIEQLAEAFDAEEMFNGFLAQSMCHAGGFELFCGLEVERKDAVRPLIPDGASLGVAWHIALHLRGESPNFLQLAIDIAWLVGEDEQVGLDAAALGLLQLRRFRRQVNEQFASTCGIREFDKRLRAEIAEEVFRIVDGEDAESDREAYGEVLRRLSEALACAVRHRPQLFDKLTVEQQQVVLTKKTAHFLASNLLGWKLRHLEDHELLLNTIGSTTSDSGAVEGELVQADVVGALISSLARRGKFASAWRLACGAGTMTSRRAWIHVTPTAWEAMLEWDFNCAPDERPDLPIAQAMHNWTVDSAAIRQSKYREALWGLSVVHDHSDTRNRPKSHDAVFNLFQRHLDRHKHGGKLPQILRELAAAHSRTASSLRCV